MKELLDILSHYRAKGISFSLDDTGTNLKIKGNIRDLSSSEKESLKEHKEGIISLLRKSQETAWVKITPVQEQVHYPLSSPQRRLWVLSRFGEANAVYNMPSAYIFEGELNPGALRLSFLDLIQRHESLRTVFREDEQGEPRQFILRPQQSAFAIEFNDLRNAEPAQAEELVQQEMSLPFDLEQGPLLRTRLLQVDNNRWIFIYVMHHIISDGWSMHILIRELLALYNSHVSGKPANLQPLGVQYKDYTAWQKQQSSSETLQRQKQYWLRQFEGELPVLELPADHARPKVKTYKGGLVQKQLDAELGSSLAALSQQQGATLFMGLLAAVKALFYGYSGQQDIIIGTPTAGREHPELEGQIGFFINTLALRTRFNPEASFRNLLEQVKEVTLGAFAHQSYPFEELVENLDLQRDRSRNPLFDVMVILQNTGLHSMELQADGLKIALQEEATAQVSKFDLTFAFVEAAAGLQLSIEYNSDIYNKATVERMASHLERLIGAAVANPSGSLEQLDYLSEDEKHQQLAEFSGAGAASPAFKTAAALFEEQAERTPQHTAILFRNQELCYEDLNALANRLANHLRKEHNIKPGELVAVKTERTPWLIISILAVLKSGGAYLPIDPAYPQERIDYMISDSGCRLVLDEEELEKFRVIQERYETGNSSSVTHPEHPAYVIYTSGTTGNPKGVAVSQGSLSNILHHISSHYPQAERIIQPFLASHAFDISIFQIFYPLLNSGTAIIAEGEDLQDTNRLIALLRQATTFDTIPGLYHLLLNHIEENGLQTEFGHIRRIFVGGDSIPDSLLHRLSTVFPGAAIAVLYGPTEGTIFCTNKIYEPGAIHPQTSGSVLGRPISGAELYVLNESGALMPQGASGEICIGGHGVASGYLNNPELTAGKFLPNPFRAGEQMYRTGDLGRWLSDGELQFIGRKDSQVKIRGYRIELGEIESALESHPDVSSCVVIAKIIRQGEKELIAYVTARQELNAGEVRAWLGKALPHYMIPSHFIQLDELPLTSNGKVDRKRLPEPEGAGLSSASEYSAPRTETEEKLVAIWQEVLGRKRIGVKDDFFELGGHSLRASRLVGQVHRVFEVQLSLGTLFENPTIEEQARIIEQSSKMGYKAISRAPHREYYPLSSAQKRLFFLQEFAPQSTGYNMPMVNYLGREADLQRITTVLHQLIARHESLRTSFEKIDGVTMQKIHSDAPFELDTHECLLHEFEDYFHSYIRPFNLAQAPLLRSSLVHIKETGYAWIVDLHHIISDGTSHQVLADDFMRLYRGEELPALRLQYRDFSEWHNNLQQSGELQKQKEYWLSRFGQSIPRLDLRADRPRPAAFTFEGSLHNFIIPSQLTEAVRAFCKKNHSTLQMTLLSVLDVLLHKYTGQDDLVIGHGIAGRRHSDLERIVGMFVNTLAIRSFPEGSKSFQSFHKEVAAACLAAYDNQDIQFEDLVDMLQVERDPSRNPVFDIALVVQNFTKSKEDLSAFINPDKLPQELRQVKSHLTSKFDMTWFVEERGEDILVSLEYYSAIYDHSTIERLSAHFINILEAALENPELLIAEIPLVDVTEERHLLRNYVPGSEATYTSINVHELFETQALLHPHHVALEDRNGIVTYEELYERSGQLAAFLANSAGIHEDDRVAILQSRSRENIVSILGVLRAGGAYVPLDSNYPEERLLYMLEDSEAAVLLADKSLIELANRLQWRSKTLKRLVCIDSNNIYAERGESNDQGRKELWEHVGNAATDAISAGGWVSSYTGEDISAEEMREYSDNAYLKLKPYLHKDMKVLEIGCSSGLTLFQVAPHVGAYHGTDLSSSILKGTAKEAAEKGLSNITLSCLPAHEIDGLDDEGFDLVIINSVIQNFDGHNYLRSVLEKTIAKMKDTGLLFIGDIMDEDKRQALIDDLKAFGEANANKGYRTKTDVSAELFLSRDYLDDLVAEGIGLSSGEYTGKIYTIPNELTEFRFDALLKVDKQQSTPRQKKKLQYDLRHIRACDSSFKRRIKSTQLSYIIYTSGSTGQPKGCAITHGNLSHYIQWANSHYFGKAGRPSFGLFTSLSFDLTVTSIFCPLTMGGSLFVYDSEESLTDLLGHSFSAQSGISCIKLTPSHISILKELGIRSSTMHCAIVGGEEVTPVHVRILKEINPHIEIYNEYGPTEATVGCIVEKLEENEPVLIGRPIAKASVYILDNELKLCPAGVPGEICIGGTGLARGYWNRPELTAEKFNANPFNSNERIYRTGDLGRWLEGGAIEFIGRKDDQVKVRGHRIELGEIEHVLQSYPSIDSCVVLAKAVQQGDKELVAYITGSQRLHEPDLRTWLGMSLPAYMIPSHFIQLDALPLNPNGKIDRKALPNPGALNLADGSEYIAPRNEVEEKLALIWQEILGKGKPGMKNNFFHLGGHSLKATWLSARIHKTFGVKVELKDLFSHPVLEDQAKLVQQATGSAFEAIPAAQPQDSYPLSSSQRRLWILSQFGEGSVAYHMPAAYVFEGTLDQSALEAAFQLLPQRHESLRTVFRTDNSGEVRQYILPPAEAAFPISHHDLRGQSGREQKAEELVLSASREHFNLEQGPLLRGTLCRLEEDRWVFSYVMHHIISDGWSMNILTTEILQFYEAHVKGTSASLRPLRIHYKDYAAWQQQQLNGGSFDQHKAYWLKQLEGELPVVELPSFRIRPAVKTYNGEVVGRTIAPELLQSINTLAREEGGTLFMALLAAVNTLLHRYSGQEDIIIGTPIAGREHADLENQIGFYLNTLPLRTQFKGNGSYRDLLRRVKQVTLDAYRHQAYPLDEMVEALDLPMDTSRSPLFDVMVALQNTSDGDARMDVEGLKVNGYKGDVHRPAKFDLTFSFAEVNGQLEAAIEYNSDILDRHTAEQLASHLEQLLRVITTYPDEPIGTISFLGSEEERLLLGSFNDPASGSVFKTAAALFEEQAERSPQHTAVIFRDQELCYAEMNALANRLARHLLEEHNIKPGELVAIKAERTPWLVISILAVLKSGGAYLPIDPAYPEDRSRFMLYDSRCRIVLDEEELERFRVIKEHYETENLSSAISPEQPAYVIYTSGTTGNPKGVAVTQGSLSNFLHHIGNNYPHPESIVQPLVASHAFDISIFHLFYPLLNSGASIIMEKEDLQDMNRFTALLKRSNTIDTVPGLYHLILNYIEENALQNEFRHIRWVFVGGDAIPDDMIYRLSQAFAGAAITNIYGPTESTVFCTHRIYEVGTIQPQSSGSHVGRPIAGAEVYVLNEAGALMPQGATGEICIGGRGVADGYLNNPELTAGKFLPNPFRAGERMYRTGDLGRWLPDGNLEFRGRKDSQVKIRGYRIELGEIENTIGTYPGVSAIAVVLKTSADGDKELVAYLVGGDVDMREVKAHAAKTLPSYMIPAHFVLLDELPLTSNGKLDRRRLPDPQELDAIDEDYVAPRSETEKRLAAIWQELLRRKHVGVNDNFFELGGHSLKAARLATQIQKTFGTKADLKELFETPVLEDQARLIDKAAGASFAAIPVVTQQESYPLSSSQRRLWVISQLAEGNMAYNMPAVYVFRGQVNSHHLEASFRSLVLRHESLRTVFREDAQGEVKQFILPETGFSIERHDLRKQHDREQQAKELVLAASREAFDLVAGPLLRATLCRLEEDKWVFCYVMHHIISDGWSMHVLMNELLQLYNAYAKGEDPALTPLRIQYKDYSAWQQEQLASGALKENREWWMSRFEGEMPVLELPLDKVRPAMKTFNGGIVKAKLKKETADALKSLAREKDSTLFMALLSVVSTLLHRYTRQEDIIIGTPIAGRDHADLEDQVGFYLNTLALRTSPVSSNSYGDLLERVRETTLEAYRKPYPFDELVDDLNLPRNLSRNALFDVMMVLQNIDVAEGKSGASGFSMEGYTEFESATSKFDLLFNFTEDGEKIALHLEYNSDMFFRETALRMAAHLEQLTSAIVASPQKAIGELDYLPAQEKHDLLVSFNDTIKEYSSHKTIHDLFEEQAARTPGNEALKQDGRSMSYEELNTRANQLAHYLISKGIKPGDNVGLVVSRSFDMMVGMYGIMKAGGAYVPIDPDYPLDRQEYISVNSSVASIVADAETPLREKLPGIEFISLHGEKIKTFSIQNPGLTINSTQLAYTIYTSGSTGRPKGVMIEHHSAVNLIEWVNTEFSIGTDDRLLFITSMCFDLSVYDIFGILAAGGTVVIARQDEVQDTRQLRRLMMEERISFWDSVPSTMNYLVGELESEGADYMQHHLRVVFMSGDWIPVQLPSRILNYFPNARVISLGGATEGTVWSNYHPVRPEDGNRTSIPYGRPITNNFFYILDDRLQPVPVGVVGELFIGGVGVAQGYANEPEKTAASFVPDPFNKQLGGRMYRTGDLGRMLPEGRMEFMGRKDAQVKIRGYRIELGEIENTLSIHPAVEAAIVLAKPVKDKDRELVAYIVSREDIHTADIRAYLGKTLPAYMIPAHFIRLNELPLTSNGKIDRKALPEPDAQHLLSATEYVAPRSATEEKLVSIWQKILGKEKISVLDDFFELGGHSLKATRLSAQIYRELEVKLELKRLFIEPVLRDQARLIDEARTTAYDAIPLAPQQESYPLSSSQRRLWIISQFEEGNIAYNMPGVHVFEGALDTDAFSSAFDALIERHESLRTVFREDAQGDIRQFILPPQETGFSITWHDLRSEKDHEEKIKAMVRSEALRPFNLAAESLVRASLYRVEDEQWVFTYVMHHIISDGWSMDILIRELLMLYNSFAEGKTASLTPLRIQYKDYASWQQQQVQEETFQTHKQYWLKQFEGELPVLQMPSDYRRPAIKTYNGASVSSIIGSTVSSRIKALCSEEGGTLFMGLLAAVNTLLYRYSHQEDIIIGSPIAGREHADLEDQIGFYVNTLALRTRFSGSDSFRQLLQNVRQLTLDAYSHQSYPFEELVDSLQLQRDMSRSALFDVMVVLQNTGSGDATSQSLGNITVKDYAGAQHHTSKFDLLFTFAEQGEELGISLEYNSDIYSSGMAERLTRHLVQLLEALVEQPSVSVNAIDYLAGAEREQLLVQFNDTTVQYADKTVMQLFEEQAEKTPTRTALVYEDRHLTYRQLNERSNQLARYIQQQTGIRQGDCMAMLLDRSEWSAIAMIAIMKLGCVYVPVDKALPASRIGYMLAESGSKAVIVSGREKSALQTYPEGLALVQVEDIPEEMDASNLEMDIPGESSSYIIYTSGSTGKPKGVEQTHKMLYNLVMWDINGSGLNKETRHLQFSSFSFDSSLHDIYYALATGGEVHILSETLRQDFWSLKDYILERQITTLSMPYAALKAIFSALSPSEFEGHCINEIISTGEQLYVTGGFRSFLQSNPSIRLHNFYGPSETHVVTGVSYCFAEGEIPEKATIGKPVHNTCIYILDAQLRPVPIGVEGEAYIGGWNLAKGYQGNPEMTREKFIEDPFSKGELVYRSGDICKWLPNGEIEYIMRRDNQLKINGYRVEPEEVENALRSHEHIEEAVVVPRATPAGDKELVAYIVGKETLSISVLRSFLGGILPSYLVPSHFVQLEILPLTPNGKIDKAALPSPEGLGLKTGAEYVAPRNETEEKLALLWSGILETPLEKTGVKDSFFDLGGHSLKAIRLISKIEKEFGTRLHIKDLFGEPTIEAIAARIERLLWVKGSDEAPHEEDTETESMVF